MLDDKTLALLGDKAAAERLTEDEVLLPCHCRNSLPELIKSKTPEFFNFQKMDDPHYVICRGCGSSTALHRFKHNAIKDWNTRSPILTPEQIKRLEED